VEDLWEHFAVLIGAGALTVLGTVAAAFAGGAPLPQRVEVTLAAIVVELFAAVGAAYDRAWAIGLAVIDAGALVIAFRIEHTEAKLLLGIPAIAALALAIVHSIGLSSGPVDPVPEVPEHAQPNPEPDPL
jgi:hypothetical protein